MTPSHRTEKEHDLCKLMLQNSVRSAKSTKCAKLNCVRKFRDYTKRKEAYGTKETTDWGKKGGWGWGGEIEDRERTHLYQVLLLQIRHQLLMFTKCLFLAEQKISGQNVGITATMQDGKHQQMSSQLFTAQDHVLSISLACHRLEGSEKERKFFSFSLPPTQIQHCSDQTIQVETENCRQFSALKNAETP